MKSTQIYRTADSSEPGFGVEIQGPVLPHTKQRLLRLFSRTHAQFTAAFTVHMASAPFNAEDTDPSGRAAPLDSSSPPGDRRSSESRCDRVCEEPHDEQGQLKLASSLGRNVLKELQCEGGTFSWTH